MIIIERRWQEWDDGGTIRNSGYIKRVERKVFSDNDIKGVQVFVNKNGEFTYNKI